MVRHLSSCPLCLCFPQVPGEAPVEWSLGCCCCAKGLKVDDVLHWGLVHSLVLSWKTKRELLTNWQIQLCKILKCHTAISYINHFTVLSKVIKVTYLPSGTLCVFSEWLLILLELPPLLGLSPPSLSRSLSPLLELRLEVHLSRCSLTEASETEHCGSWLLSTDVPWLATVAVAEAFEGAALVLVPMDLEMTLSLWELGL